MVEYYEAPLVVERIYFDNIMAPSEFTAIHGSHGQVRRLECEHLSLTFGERNLPTTLIEQAVLPCRAAKKWSEPSGSIAAIAWPW